jgi:hypothetical protein
MPARLLVLIALAVALAGLAQAAPAPLRRPQPDQPEVVLSGWLPHPSLADGAPSMIVRQADYQSVAKAYGITNLPKVDFRTHFLFVHVRRGYGEIGSQIDGSGDLRATATAAPDLLYYGDGGGGFGKGGPGGYRFLIRSFRRSAVKTVEGVSVPRD